MIKTNIKMRVNPEQLVKLSKIFPICKRFSLAKYIYVYKNNVITWDNDDSRFIDNKDLEEVDADLFIRTNGTCIENPNEHLDRLDDIVDKAIKEVLKEDSHNAHYKAQRIDTITRCKANMTLEQQKAICIFNCDKYLHRSKGQDLEDIQKVRYYLNWLEEIEIQLKDKE